MGPVFTFSMPEGAARLLISYAAVCGRHNFRWWHCSFPFVKSVHATGLNSGLNKYKDKMTELLREFKQWFQIFVQLKTDFQVFCSPFTVNPFDLPVDWQLETIDL